MSNTVDEQFQAAFSLHEAGELDKAGDEYRRIVESHPDHADSLHLLGVLCHQQGDHEGGIGWIRKALAAKPGNPAFLYNLGVIFQETGRDSEAEKCYRETLAADPQAVSAWVNLGNLMSGTGRFSEAVDCHRNALALQPNDAEHHVRLGNSLKMQGYVENALSHFGFAFALDRNHAAAHSSFLFASQYEPGIDLPEISRRHREWWSCHGKSPQRTDRHSDSHWSKGDVVRIGFVSPDFGNHPVGIFLAPLLERLRKRADAVTFCYSDSRHVDEFLTRNRAAANHWREIRGLDTDAVVSTIREDKVHILFDLTGHTDNNRLPVFVRKPAPIQITWAGYVGSTGLETMDYLLTDPFHTPEEFDEYYTETPLRLKRNYVPYEPPEYSPEVGPLPMLKNGFPTFGCLNNPTKLSFPVIQVWSAILRELPKARLILKYKGMNDRSVQVRIRGLFASQGVTPDRIELIGQTQHRPHLEFFNRIDVALDPFPYSSGLSACEALWMGVPVVTCPGDTFASRHALSHLSNAGISGTVARDWPEYVEFAVNLVHMPEELQRVRATLRNQVAASPLCDLDGYAEDFMKAMFRILTKH